MSYAPAILDLVQRRLAEGERTDSSLRHSYGLIGDIADCFPQGQIEQVLLQNCVTTASTRNRGCRRETKEPMRWAHDVRFAFFLWTGLTSLCTTSMHVPTPSRSRYCIDTSIQYGFTDPFSIGSRPSPHTPARLRGRLPLRLRQVSRQRFTRDRQS